MESERQERIFAALDEWAPAPENGLPFELFRYLTRLLPVINVDLLICDERRGTLLTWRHDDNYGPGWHIPGGIIRYKETAEERIRLTAQMELRAEVEFDPAPIAIEQTIRRGRRERGHMISLLYRCRLKGSPAEELRLRDGAFEPGQWAWHRSCPENLIVEQDRYRKFF